MQVLVHVEPGLQEPGLLRGGHGPGDDPLEALLVQYSKATAHELGRGAGAVRNGDEESNRTVGPPSPDPGGLSTPGMLSPGWKR